jgi:hypothetical protein
MWVTSRYKPTPTIIEAAQALYRGHRVDEITRSDAGAINLSQTAATDYALDLKNFHLIYGRGRHFANAARLAAPY